MSAMTEQEVQDYIRQANWFMRGQIEENRKNFQLDSLPRFEWDQWRRELVFSVGGDPKVVGQIQIAGNHSPKAGSWTWAWANNGLLEPIRRASLKAREFGNEKGIIRLIQPKWAAKESDAWEMTAVVSKLIDAKGAFRCPSPDGFTYMVFTDLRTVTNRKRIFGVQACSHILEQDQPILLVSREADGETLAMCGGENDGPATTKSVAMQKLLDLDPTLSLLADLPDGWVALRESADDDWVRSKAE